MEPRVVMVNLVQCWRCKQYIPPGEEIRARVMQTAVEYGNGLNGSQVNRFEPVSVCVFGAMRLLLLRTKRSRTAARAACAGWAGYVGISL